MSTAHAESSYRTYWIAWLVLLAITLVMLVVASPVVVLAGISLKAAIICLWFMHLRYERWDFATIIAVFIFATAVFLALLTYPDGAARLR